VGVTIRSAASWARMKGVVEERMEYVRWARAKGPKKMDGELGLAPNACRMRQVGCVALTLQCTSSQLDTHRFVLERSILEAVKGIKFVVSAKSHASAVRVRERAVYPTVAKCSVEVQRFSSLRAPGLSPSARPLIPSRSCPLPQAPALRAPPCSTARLLSSPAQGPRPGWAPPTPGTLHALAPSVVESPRLAAGSRRG